jgi:hypothetical protein
MPQPRSNVFQQPSSSHGRNVNTGDDCTVAETDCGDDDYDVDDYDDDDDDDTSIIIVDNDESCVLEVGDNMMMIIEGDNMMMIITITITIISILYNESRS